MNQLAPLYYLDNFISLLNSVYALYDDLLTAAERDFYLRFMALDADAQALLVRLLSRKGLVFRVKKLTYAEITDIPLAIATLLSNDFISEPRLSCVDELFSLFTKAEWLKVIESKVPKSSSKGALRSHLPEGDELLPTILSVTDDSLVKLHCRQIFDTYKLLFFGNGRQDLTDFITEDLGIFQYECYAIHKQSRFFDNRLQVENMLQYYGTQEDFLDLKAYGSEQLISLLGRLPALQSSSGESDESGEGYVETALNRRIQSAYLRVARQLERLGSLEEALSLYRFCDQPPSRERQVRILHKQQKSDELRKLCKELLQSGSEAEKVFAQRFLVKIKQSEKGGAKPYTPPRNELVLPESEHGVELGVAAYLAEEGDCFYVENQLFLSLFGLVFWPAIFADVKGAFTHKFQYQPHDLFEPHFAHRRKKEILQGWLTLEKWIAQPAAAVDFYNLKCGVSNPFVVWAEGFEVALICALQRIPYSHFKAIFQRLWHNLKENSSGFPDLIFFPMEGGYTLVEVKGPGDRVQNNQVRWLEYFAKQGIPHRVTHVRWRE